MKKIEFLILLLGICLAIGAFASIIQLHVVRETIKVSEGERTSLLIENWSILPSPFKGIIQLGVMDVPEHEVVLDTTPPSVPEELMVYEVIKPVVDEKFARKIVDKLGFIGELVPVESGEVRWAYVFTNDTHTLEVELDGSVRFYRKKLPETGTLPTEEECISIAESWLKEHDLYPSNISKVKAKASLMSGDKLAVIGVSFWTKIENFTLQNLVTYVGITYNGLVHEVILTIYDFKSYVNFKLKTPTNALKILKAYLDSGGIPPKGQNPSCITNSIAFKRLIVKKISLEYYYGKKYIQPVYVFEGEADGQDFIGIVDAVDRSA